MVQVILEVGFIEVVIEAGVAFLSGLPGVVDPTANGAIKFLGRLWPVHVSALWRSLLSRCHLELEYSLVEELEPLLDIEL